jgi:hypothetical protein
MRYILNEIQHAITQKEEDFLCFKQAQNSDPHGDAFMSNLISFSS